MLQLYGSSRQTSRYPQHIMRMQERVSSMCDLLHLKVKLGLLADVTTGTRKMAEFILLQCGRVGEHDEAATFGN